MSRNLGDPKHPCHGIQKSKRYLSTIESEARANADAGTAPVDDVERSLDELKKDTVDRLGRACGTLCPKYGRCILESFGPDDPLLRKPYSTLSADQQREFDAKRHLDMLSILSKQALGIV